MSDHHRAASAEERVTLPSSTDQLVKLRAALRRALDESAFSDDERHDIVLQQLRIATSESIVLTSTRQTTPSDAAASGLAEESDKGTTTTTPVRSQSVLDALLFGGTGG